MKFLTFFSLLLFIYIPIFAQDSTAYELQRSRVNSMLQERSSKFQQYDQSLTNRTGIFGLQTKKDIRNSNEILRSITLTDNEIFKELKVLMDFKEMQVQRGNENAANAHSIKESYKQSIKHLQDQIQNQKDKHDLLEKRNKNLVLLLILLSIGLVISGSFSYKFLRKPIR